MARRFHSGELMLAKRSEEYDFKDMYGCTKPFGDLRQHSHGMFPACHNYPPSRCDGVPSVPSDGQRVCVCVFLAIQALRLQ